MSIHKDERIHEEAEANATGRYSTFTICYCNVGKDHEHFTSMYAYHQADIGNRLDCMQNGKPIPKSNVVPPYYKDLPRFEETNAKEDSV